MPFIPHTEADIKAMLAAIGVEDIDALFDEIPASLQTGSLARVPPALNEMQIGRLMQERAARDGVYLNFVGAGAYEHHVPAAVWEITTRGEFYSAYTPYQAEASQGTLQLLYEYQTMMAGLTGMDMANASLYDGASALAEAALMAVRAHKKARRILMPRTVHPIYRRVVHAIVRNQNIELVEPPYSTAGGHTEAESLARFEGESIAALVIPQPNFFGVLEEVDALTDWAHANGALAVALVNPTSLALLKPPGEWGAKGADIAVGEGQPLGAPLSSGGPYFGFMACKSALARQMPGRIAGRTIDADGKPGFTLTLQAREQHIRRSKATSNICTNQGLIVTAATIYMSLLGPDGLERVARACHANTRALVARLASIPGVERVFDRPVFHEAVLRLDGPVGETLRALEAGGIVGGFDLTEHYPELGQALLVCATETRTVADMEHYAARLADALARSRHANPTLNLMEGHSMAQVTLRGTPIHTNADVPAVGAQAPEFRLVDADLKELRLADLKGKKKLLNIVPSLDTPVCATSTKKFNDFAKGRGDVAVLTISADLPFALKRFCSAENIGNVKTLSLMRGRDFAESYGVLIQDGPLAGITARAVVVLDENDKVIHTELVPEIGQEPNYEAAIAVLK